MKKWIATLAVLLGTSVSLAAPVDKISCANEFQQGLEIVRDNEAGTVTAALAANGDTQSFVGSVLPTGKFAMQPTATNESVALVLVRPRDHGGGCGRCFVDSTPTSLSAQLVVGAYIFVFQCQQK